MQQKVYRLVACALLLAMLSVSAAANTPFAVGIIDGTDGQIPGGAVGTGIDVVDGGIYQAPFQVTGATGEPQQHFMVFDSTLQFDSYLTIDRGPVEPPPGYGGGDVSPASLAPGSVGFYDSSLRAGWFVGGAPIAAFRNEIAPFGGVSSIFLGRITHVGHLSGRLRVSLFEGEDMSYKAIEGDLLPTNEVVAGIGRVITDVDGNPTQAWISNNAFYAFVVRSFYTVLDRGPLGELEVRVSDLYLIQASEVTCPDVDGDGTIGLGDLSSVLFNFGSEGWHGDANGDEVIDISDISSVLFHFGENC